MTEQQIGSRNEKGREESESQGGNIRKWTVISGIRVQAKGKWEKITKKWTRTRRALGRPAWSAWSRPQWQTSHCLSSCSSNLRLFCHFPFLFSITSGTITSSPLSHWLSSHSVNSACTRHVFPAYFFFCSPYGLCLLPLDFVRNDAELPAVLLQPELLAVNAIIKLDKKKNRCYGTVEQMVPTAAISGHFISKFTTLLVHFCVG